MANIPLLRSREEDEFAGSSTCPLLLTTMAGNEIQIVVPFSIHRNWEMLEDYLVERLPAVSQSNTFGCEVTLLDADTQHVLCDPIQEELWNNTRFHLIVRDCFRSCSGKEQLQRDVYEALPKAIWVPVNDWVSSRLKPFSRLHDSDMSKWNLGSIPSIGKRGDTVNRSELSSCQKQS